MMIWRIDSKPFRMQIGMYMSYYYDHHYYYTSFALLVTKKNRSCHSFAHQKTHELDWIVDFYLRLRVNTNGRRLINANRFLIAGVIKYIHIAIVDCVLLAAGGNHSADVISGSTSREIRAVHHDTGYSEVSAIEFIHDFPISRLIKTIASAYQATVDSLHLISS